ncbi:hypothetical protein [Sphingomonas sp. CFBP 13720]|uniref:hypothetical protein n=1 Tax=Sphingomonas sp. CFBP 13720 TaxID=2775302 RepID=UPI00177BAABE|nr:hypothetical protein [Sphingomonas sp. CFBP 13720]MBD8678372.1 hypothetical protein [Sphingomonas sp. CFBP 13720]
MASDRIVAVGLLTERDLAVLGNGFTRMFPVQNDSSFDDLLAKLENISATPVHTGTPGKRRG